MPANIIESVKNREMFDIKKRMGLFKFKSITVIIIKTLFTLQYPIFSSK